MWSTQLNLSTRHFTVWVFTVHTRYGIGYWVCLLYPSGRVSTWSSVFMVWLEVGWHAWCHPSATIVFGKGYKTNTLNVYIYWLYYYCRFVQESYIYLICYLVHSGLPLLFPGAMIIQILHKTMYLSTASEF